MTGERLTESIERKYSTVFTVMAAFITKSMHKKAEEFLFLRVPNIALSCRPNIVAKINTYTRF